MNLLEDIATWIISGGHATAIGTDIFCNFDPDLIDELIILYEYDSVSSDIRGNNATVRYVQVVVRKKQPSDASTLASSLYHFCRREDSDDPIYDFPGGRWAIIDVKQPPLKIEVDANKRVSFAFNMAITTTAD